MNEVGLRICRVFFVTEGYFANMPQDLERCKRVSNAINGLEQMELEELFKLLHRNGCQYTSNNNGVFVNLSRLSEGLMEKIEQYIAFCNQSRHNVKKYESLCEVLNKDIVDAGHTTSHRTRADNVRTPLYVGKSVGGNGNGGAGAGNTGGNGAAGAPEASRVSSSMKFYLLKKKYSKATPPNVGFKDDVEMVPDAPLMQKMNMV